MEIYDSDNLTDILFILDFSAVIWLLIKFSADFYGSESSNKSENCSLKHVSVHKAKYFSRRFHVEQVAISCFEELEFQRRSIVLCEFLSSFRY